MKELVLIENPNLSIVLPGKCNAHCSFCFTDYSKESDSPPYDEYFVKLYNTLNELPDNFEQISITGGEPTISPYLDIVLQTISLFRKKFNFVVLTTNGTGLTEKLISDMSGIVDAVNISRHHYDDIENNKIFQFDKMPTKEDLHSKILLCKKYGIEPSLSIVIDKLTTKSDILKFIEFAKDIDILDVRIRHVQTPTTIIERHGVELEFDEELTFDSRCPVCRHTGQVINGSRITWISSTLEPSNDWNVIYEAIFHQNGYLTIDWAGDIEYLLL